MSISLTVAATTVTLHPDLRWNDEFWSPVAQTETRAITGNSIIQVAPLVGGKPITLAPDDDSSAWTPLSVLNQLRTWAATPGQLMTLSLRGVDYTVLWRHQDKAVEANPLVHYSDTAGEDFYLATLRFIEVE